jgi:predicted dienelactone hydrolase
MHFIVLFLAMIVVSIATPAVAAGIRLIDIPAGGDNPAFRGIMWSPCASAAGEVVLRDFTFSGTRNCAVAGERLPLIVISHGRTGWSARHHDTATVLADAGFVVVAIDHPIDSDRSKTKRIEDIAYLTERPANIKRVIDFMLDESRFSSSIDRDRIGIFGFSRGAYTGLVLVGGEPSRDLAQRVCGRASSGTLCQQINEGKFPPSGYVHDARIKAAVLADAAPAFFFGPAELANVKVPLLLWASEHGGRGADAKQIANVGQSLPNKTDVNIVRGAAHFVVLAPCLADGIRNEPEYCVDANGVDRVAFHREFNAAALAFFRQHLGN